MQSPAEGLARCRQADALGIAPPAPGNARQTHCRAAPTPAFRHRPASAPQRKGPPHEGRCRENVSPIPSTAMPAAPTTRAGSSIAPTRGARAAS